MADQTDYNVPPSAMPFADSPEWKPQKFEGRAIAQADAVPLPAKNDAEIDRNVPISDMPFEEKSGRDPREMNRGDEELLSEEPCWGQKFEGAAGEAVKKSDGEDWTDDELWEFFEAKRAAEMPKTSAAEMYKQTEATAKTAGQGRGR